MTLVQIVILLAFIWFANKGLFRYFVDNFSSIRWIVVGFAGYFIVVVLRMPFSSSGVSSLDGPLRVLLALTCIGFVGWFQPRIRWFWLGLCIGAVSAGIVAVVERGLYGVDHRVTGFTTHSITFGNLALALGLMSLCALPSLRNTRLSFLPVLAMLAGLVASILSGSRGGWLALFLCIFLLVCYGRRTYGRAIAYVGWLVTSIFILAYFIPGTNVHSRIGSMITDIELYFLQQNASTSLGIRFELWKGSLLMFADNPLFGVGRAHFLSAMESLVQQGRLQPSAAIDYSHSHNDLLYSLASGGLLDTAFLVLIYLAPLRIFLPILGSQQSECRQIALAGLLLVASFVGFGLTESMFWLMTPKIFYAMLVCVLIGFCLTADRQGTIPLRAKGTEESRSHSL